MSATLSRRRFIEAGGALVVAFAWPGLGRVGRGPASGSAPAGRLPSSGDPPLDQLDSWLAIGADGAVTLFSGKVELGTGVETALAQIVAEELDVGMARIRVVQGDTAATPNQGMTVGSQTLQRGGVQVRRAAATARARLIALAATRLDVDPAQLTVHDGVVSAGGDPARAVSYAALVGGRRFEHTVDEQAAMKDPSRYTVVGTPAARLELPEKVYGTHVYVHNVRVPGMLHGRVIRPPAIGATLVSVDEGSVARMPGVAGVVHRGSFVGVMAEREEEAIAAARALRVQWRAPATPLPSMASLYERMRAAPAEERELERTGDAAAAIARAQRPLGATYRTPYQSHGSIGPSCAVADVRGDTATIWSGTQGSYPLRDAIAGLLGLDAARVRVIWTEASGCYGHNGADDAAGDAALLSQRVGRPVRVQWSRADELGWDPKTPAMLIDVRGALAPDGAVAAWDYVVTTPTHSTRPGGHAGNLLAGQLIGLEPRSGFGGGDRNARHSYAIPDSRVTVRWIARGAIRPSAMRGLGAPANVFASESFMDELAAAAGADPVQFRLRHLRDPRAAAVVRRAADLSRWASRPSPRSGAVDASGPLVSGRGIAFAQYENRFTYVATVVEVEVHRDTGAVRVPRAFVAHDCGLVVNPDGLRNQIEGATVQTVSRALLEEVTWDARAVTSVDWRSYPILAFPDVPEQVEIALLDHPEQPAWGAGEPPAVTVPAAIANAIFDATGARVRSFPMTRERVREALAAARRA